MTVLQCPLHCSRISQKEICWALKMVKTKSNCISTEIEAEKIINNVSNTQNELKNALTNKNRC